MKDFARFGMFSLGALVFATTAFAQNVDDATPFDDQIIAEPFGFPDDPSVAQVTREMGCSYDETGTSVYLPKTGEAVQLDETTGDEATGDEATGDEATGDEATGDEATGDEATGDEATGDEATGDEATGDEATGDEATGDEARDEDGSDLNVASIYSNPPVYVICELWPDDTIMQISGGPHVQRGTIESSWWRDFNAPLAAHDIKRSSQRNEPAQLPQVTPESFAEFCARPGLLQTLFCPIS